MEQKYIVELEKNLINIEKEFNEGTFFCVGYLEELKKFQDKKEYLFSKVESKMRNLKNKYFKKYGVLISENYKLSPTGLEIYYDINSEKQDNGVELIYEDLPSYANVDDNEEESEEEQSKPKEQFKEQPKEQLKQKIFQNKREHLNRFYPNLNLIF